MNTHPYFNVFACCAIAVTILLAIDMGLLGCWLWSKWRAAAELRQAVADARADLQEEAETITLLAAARGDDDETGHAW